MDYYIFESGRLKRKDNSIAFDNGESEIRIPIETVKSITTLNETDLNTRLLELLNKYEITLNVYSRYGRYIGSFVNDKHIDGKVILNECRTYDERRRDVVNAILDAYFHNQKMVLHPKNNRSQFDEQITKMESVEKFINKEKNIDRILMYEARIKRIYYSCLSELIGNKDFVFKERSYNPPEDRINSLISFCNSLLYAKITQLTVECGLSPAIGYLHETTDRDNSLSLDISEIYKPLICDKVVLKAIHLKMITKDDFEEKDGGVYMTKKGMKTIATLFDERINESIEINGKRKRYETLIKEDLYAFKKFISGGKSLKLYHCKRV